MIRKAMSIDIERPQREYYIGLTIFIFVHLIARIIYFIHDITAEIVDFIYVGDPILWELAALVGIGSVIFLVYAIERNIFTRTKFIITIIVIINLILLIILPEEFKDIIRIFNTSLVGAFLPLIYVIAAYKSTGIYRKYLLITAVGILIFLGGQGARSDALFVPDNIIFFIISPILMIIGGAIYLYGLTRQA